MKENPFRAWTIYFLLILLIATYLFLTDQFRPVTQLDTAGYADFPFGSGTEALNYHRTVVYPSVLYATQTQIVPYFVVPSFQFAVASMAVAFFFGTLLRCGWPSGLALAASIPLMTGSMVLEYGSMILPDSLAQSLAILTIACWMRQVWFPQSWLWLLVLGLLTFLCYQTKPSYLFLVGFVPVAGAIARWWLFGSQSGYGRLGIKLAFCSTLPFLGWCCFRWALVGHFGLVSFGGYNVVGITGQMLRREEVARLSETLQPLATAILDNRDQRIDWSSRMTYSVYESQYNPMVWEIAVPAASRIYNNDPRRINLELARLSREVIGLRPVRYGIWLMLASKRAVTESIRLSLTNPATVVSLFLITCGFAANWFISKRNQQPSVGNRFAIQYQTMVWLGIGYAVCAMALVVLVETPLPRYCAPASVFMPSWLSMCAFQMWNTTDSRGVLG